jgi:3' terminal RNA ribose 2'-O-methyltransferase Hen1
VGLSGEIRLKDLLSHLYVLIPALDGGKHYWVEDAEVEKLLRHGEGWLSSHPEKEFITRRYLKYQRSLADDALSRLMSEEIVDPAISDERRIEQEASLEAAISLNDQRMATILSTLKGLESRRVLDLGCGEGKLLKVLLEDRHFDQIVGMDVSHRSLEKAQKRLRFDQMAPMMKKRVKLMQGSLVYRDKRLTGYDAACLVEVVEHLDPPRLSSLERVVFEFAKPKVVLVTTPNAEYNAKFDKLPAGKFRHQDHRFEWTRQEFQKWSDDVAQRYGYAVDLKPIGPVDSSLGAPTQMAVFRS